MNTLATPVQATYPVDEATTAAVATTRVRIESIDVLRGLVMVLMALDHTRDFFGDLAAQPTNLDSTTAALFFTRWITHFCAPVFFLLAGTGAWLSLRRMSRRELSGFLLGRGVWLIFLEVVVMRFALQFNADYQTTVLTVLWGLGWAMIVLSLLVRLPMWTIAGFGAILLVGHNALDGIPLHTFGRLAPLWCLLHVPGVIYDDGHAVVVVGYVLIPWVGVTALGYVLGQVFDLDAAVRRRLLLRLGLGLSAAFIVLRLLNVYGNPTPWAVQGSALWTVMSFLNVEKYPPSLLFLLMTLGPALLLLRALDGEPTRVLRPLLVFGKVPLFFFVVHFFLIHALAVGASWLRYGRVGEMFSSPDLAHFPFSQPAGWAAGLPTIYLLWIAVVVGLFPLCCWYAGIKRRHRTWWLSYL